MGLNVAIQDERGKQRQIVLDEKNLIGPLLGYPTFLQSPMIASIDRYGDTIFNRVQINQFLIEWEEINQRASTVDERILIRQVKEFAEMVRDSVHIYLIFIGD